MHELDGTSTAITQSQMQTRSSKTSNDAPGTMVAQFQARCAPTEMFPSPRTLIRTDFRNMHEMATIIVGKKDASQTYLLHKTLLVSVSPFFEAALMGAFSESRDQTVTLPEEKPEVFEWFMWWLYSGSLTSPMPTNCSTTTNAPTATLGANTSNSHFNPVILPPSTHGHSRHPHLSSTNEPSTSPSHHDGDLRNAAGSPKYFLLLDLYALSDLLLTTSLSNHIIDTIARLSEATNSVPTPSDTFILYNTARIRDTAPIHQLILDLFAYKKTDKLLETHRDEWHPRFLRELVVRLKRGGPETLDRHTLVSWRCTAWQAVRVCEGCRELVRPGSVAERCEVCERTFCTSCVRTGKVGVMGAGGEVGVCKPWLRGMCVRYHEHGKGEGCVGKL